MTTIPASIDVDVIPGVVGAGGNALATIGLCLDNSTRIPISPLGSILSFPTAAEVGEYFGLGSPQENFASVYFNGFTGRTAIPSALLFSQYPAWAVAAWLRGGPLGLTLAEMQALSGSLTAVIDGYSHVISSISLAGYNSFSAAAAGIEAAFTDPTEASFTASIGASFTASGSGTNLTVSVLAYGYISAGDTVTGTGIPSGTTIVSQTSGTPGGTGVYVTSAVTTASTASCEGLSTVLDVTIDTDNSIAAGQTIAGSGVTGTPLITSQISGTAGGVGLYRISGAQQTIVPPEAMTASATAPVVTYDSISEAFVITSGITGSPSTAAFATGTLAAPLKLTQATGAVLSQGANATSPAVFMDTLSALNQDWVSFTTDFEPDAAYFVGSISTTTLTISTEISGTPIIGDTVSGPGVTPGTVITGGSGLSWTISPSQTVNSANLSSFAPGGGHGNTQKLAFAAWNNSVPDEYLYAMWDTDITPTESDDATNSAGYIVNDLEYEGVAPIYEPSNLLHAPFLMGSIASINFAATNGRTNLKFRTQAGLVPSVTSETVAVNLKANGYNCVGAVATASQQFIYWRDGQVSGKFDWIDSYIDQIWLNNMMQQTLLELLLAVGSLPYNPQGYNLIAGALTGGSALPIVLPPASPVAAALNFGAIRPNVPLSASQAEEVNNAAGLAIDGILSTRGWYLQILPPTAQVRAARGTPICNFWYTDGQSINQITLNSIEVE